MKRRSILEQFGLRATMFSPRTWDRIKALADHAATLEAELSTCRDDRLVLMQNFDLLARRTSH